MRWIATAVVVAVFFCGCETIKASGVPTPKARVTECEQICTDVGMKLGAMVVMMNHAGCVCEVVNNSTQTSRKGGGAVSAGTTVIAAAAAAAANAYQQQQYRPPASR